MIFLHALLVRPRFMKGRSTRLNEGLLQCIDSFPAKMPCVDKISTLRSSDYWQTKDRNATSYTLVDSTSIKAMTYNGPR